MSQHNDSVVMLSDIYAESGIYYCHAECYCAECHCAECHGAFSGSPIVSRTSVKYAARPNEHFSFVEHMFCLINY